MRGCVQYSSLKSLSAKHGESNLIRAVEDPQAYHCESLRVWHKRYSNLLSWYLPPVLFYPFCFLLLPLGMP